MTTYNLHPVAEFVHFDDDDIRLLSNTINIYYTRLAQAINTLMAASGGNPGAAATASSQAYTPGTTTYTIPAAPNGSIYHIGNAALIPTVDYSISSTTLTLLTVGGMTPATRFPNSDTLWGMSW